MISLASSALPCAQSGRSHSPASDDRPDKDEPADQEHREEEEPREIEAAGPVADDVHDLHILAILLRDLHLLDALGDAVLLARPVRPDPDPREDRHDHGHDHHSSTHVKTSLSRV